MRRGETGDRLEHHGTRLPRRTLSRRRMVVSPRRDVWPGSSPPDLRLDRVGRRRARRDSWGAMNRSTFRQMLIVGRVPQLLVPVQLMLVLLTGAASGWAAPGPEVRWPRFRGPDGAGIGRTDFPIHF